MNTRIHVVPAKGRVVRDPKTLEPLPPKGCQVETSNYWRRRARCGDVTIKGEKTAADIAAERRVEFDKASKEASRQKKGAQ